MIQTIKKPDRPYFIFDRKMWEIENELDSIHADEDYRTVVTFEHTYKTSIIDPDVGFDLKKLSEAGPAWIIAEIVEVSISGEYAGPIVTMWQKNTGTMVGKEREGSGRTIQEIDTISLPLFVIEKLVKEAVKIDVKNRYDSSFVAFQ